MTKKFEIDLPDKEIGKRVRAIMGVPDALLTDEVISSPIFKAKANAFINKSIKEYTEFIEDDCDFTLLDISAMYYIGYLLCPGMDARLPKQMENLSTKTIMQNISWDQKSVELYDMAVNLISNFLDEYDIEEEKSYLTTIDLSDEQDYPETNI